MAMGRFCNPESRVQVSSGPLMKVNWEIVEDQDLSKMIDDLQKSEGFDEWCQQGVKEAIIFQLKLMGCID